MDLCTVTGSAAWAPSWWTGRCSRAPASTPACRRWACGRRCWRRAFSTTVGEPRRVYDVSAGRPRAAVFAQLPCSASPCAVLCALQWTRSRASRTSTSSTASWRTSGRTPRRPARRRGSRARRSCRTPCCSSRRSGRTPTWGWSWGNSTNLMQKSPKLEQWQEWLSWLLLKCLYFLFFFLCSPSERTAEDLEIIYEELLHIKALAHLSTTVSRGAHLPASFSGIKTVIRASFRGSQLDKPDTTAKNSICSANSSVNLNKNKFCKNEVNLSEYLVMDSNCNLLGNLYNNWETVTLNSFWLSWRTMKLLTSFSFLHRWRGNWRECWSLSPTQMQEQYVSRWKSPTKAHTGHRPPRGVRIKQCTEEICVVKYVQIFAWT